MLPGKVQLGATCLAYGPDKGFRDQVLQGHCFASHCMLGGGGSRTSKCHKNSRTFESVPKLQHSGEHAKQAGGCVNFGRKVECDTFSLQSATRFRYLAKVASN